MRCLSWQKFAVLLLALAMPGCCGRALADQLIFPATSLERGKPVRVVYHLDKPATGNGVLAVSWTDTYGRVVDRRALRFALVRGTQIAFQLDLRRARALENELRVHLSFDGKDAAGGRDHRETDAHASFLAHPVDRDWSDYQIIMWQARTAEQYRALRGLGITAGAVPGDRGGDGSRLFPSRIEPLLDSDLSWYVENIATDFYSAYHRWVPDHPVNWKFLAAHALHQEHPEDRSAFERDPSLSDPRSLQEIRGRLNRSARAHAPYWPLYYSLGDETGIGDLSISWDFDVSPDSLAGMRVWLRRQYGSLAALNAQWGTRYARWDQVMPMLTSEAMRRRDSNFSAWADFKGWMDVAFARALAAGTAAIHAGDPHAPAAIEGAQVPGWGGYDYSLLTRAVDLIELYDGGDNLEITRSLNPEITVLTTSASTGAEEQYDAWREWLRGSRGLILWDPNGDYVHQDGSVGARGAAMAPIFAELRSGLGALVINSRRDWAPIAMLYSPASMRLQWLLDWKPKGDAWSKRSVEASYEDENAVRSSMTGFSRLFEHMGLEHRVISSALLESGELRRGGYRLLVLPRAIALSAREAAEIRRFVERGGLLVADGEPGRFDQHGRSLSRPRLADVLRGAPAGGSSSASFGRGKAVYLSPADPAAASTAEAEHAAPTFVRLRQVIADAHIGQPFTLTDASGNPVTDVEMSVFRNGGVRVVALQRDLPARPTDETEAGRAGPETVSLALSQRSFLYDMRLRQPLGQRDRVELALGSTGPVILSVSETPLPRPTIQAPATARLGETVELRLGVSEKSPAAVDVLHIDVVDPRGETVRYYSGNVLMRQGNSVRLLPLAFNDPAGIWKIQVTDVMTGEAATAELTVSEP